VAVFQPNPADAKSTITTVMIALAVGSSTLDQKKKYENVPVLRNLVPSQVLLGNSSFNTGNSISAGCRATSATASRRSPDSRSRLSFNRLIPCQRPLRRAVLFCSHSRTLGVMPGLDPGTHEAMRGCLTGRSRGMDKQILAETSKWSGLMRCIPNGPMW
jgi:hypothetical protein